MLAKIVDAVIETELIEAAVAAVDDELIPEFRAHDGAQRGYWMADRTTGHVLAITMWRDADSLRAAAAAEGAARAAVGDRIGLSLRAVHTLPVVASAHVADPVVGRPVPRWVRVTWFEGADPSMRAKVPELHEATVAAQAGVEGFCGSYWLADEHRSEGFAISLWDFPTRHRSGAGASRRRRRRLAKELGFSVRTVRHYEVVGVSHDSSLFASDETDSLRVDKRLLRAV